MPVVSPLSSRRVELAPSEPGVISAIAEGSLGDDLGLQVGDRVLRVNGRELVDALDFQFYAQSERVALEVTRASEPHLLELELEGDEFWGLTFADPTFDGIRVCENACPFCFIKQIPKGMRRSLYVMDDDYRYSMLYGSFVTLTNLSEADWARIEEQHISPLHVSVHATEPELRVALVGNPKAAQVMDDLRRLETLGIDFHCQLVLVPGVNDGPALDRTLEDLATFGNRLLSIAAVPVGLTRFGLERQSKQMRLSRTCMRTLPGKRIDVRRYMPDEAAAVVEHAERWRKRFRADKRRTLFHLGDEFYLMAGLPVPTQHAYDGFPQIEDGIGITRVFLDRLEGYIRRSTPGTLAGEVGTIACGELIAPTMMEAVERFNGRTGADLEVLPVENHFLGREITVSGLLTGQDVAQALSHRRGRGPVFLSSRMLSDRTGTLLDDMTVSELAGEIGRPVSLAEDLPEVAKLLRSRRRRRILVAA